MPYAQGTSEGLYVGFEDSFKTLPATVNADKVPVVSPNVRPVRNKHTSKALTDSSEPRSVVFGKVAVEGDMGIECSPTAMYPWMKGIYSAPTTGGTTDLYHHRFNLGTQLSMWFERKFSTLTKFLVYKGIYLGSLGVQMMTEGVMEARVGFMGAIASASAGATIINGTTTDRTTQRSLSYLLGRIKKNGSTIGYVKTISLDVNRNLGRDAAIDETNEQAVIFSEIPTVGGNITALFSTATLYDEALDGTESALELFVPFGTGQGYMVFLPAVVLSPFAANTQGTGLTLLEGGYDAQPTGSTTAKVWSKYITTEAAMATTTLVISVDGGADQTVTFVAADDTPDEMVTAINAGTTGCTASVQRMSGETGGVILIQSDSTGTSASIQVKSSSTADVLLGFDNSVHNGLSSVSHEAWLFNTVA